MYSKVKIVGRPVHPMLVNFPIAFYVSTLMAFIVYKVSSEAFWFKVGLAANISGIATTLVAAAFGFIDWAFGIPKRTAAKNTGLKHMLLNVTSLILFVICLILNVGQWSALAPISRGAVILPLFGVILTVLAGYFGWKLVQNHHVGVEFSSDEALCISDLRRIDQRV